MYEAYGLSAGCWGGLANCAAGLVLMGEYLLAAAEALPSSGCEGKYCAAPKWDGGLEEDEYFCLLYGSASSIMKSPS